MPTIYRQNQLPNAKFESGSILLNFLVGAMFFATGSFRQGSATCMCVATKKHAILYELNRTKGRHRKFKVNKKHLLKKVGAIQKMPSVVILWTFCLQKCNYSLKNQSHASLRDLFERKPVTTVGWDHKYV